MQDDCPFNGPALVDQGPAIGNVPGVGSEAWTVPVVDSWSRGTGWTDCQGVPHVLNESSSYRAAPWFSQGP